MTSLLNDIDLQPRDNNSQDNLFVNKIIVNKQLNSRRDLLYVPTEKWVNQLGARLETNF